MSLSLPMDLDPVFEGQVAGDDKALSFVGAADDIEEQLGSGFSEGDVAEFVDDEQVLFLELFAQAR